MKLLLSLDFCFKLAVLVLFYGNSEYLSEIVVSELSYETKFSSQMKCFVLQSSVIFIEVLRM